MNYHHIESDIMPPASDSQQILSSQPSIRNLNFEFAVDLDSDITHATNASLDSIPIPAREHVHLVYPSLRPRSDSAAARLGSPRARLNNQFRNSGVDFETYDTFEQCLHVTNQMESIMAYHYQDEENKDCFKFEEIFTFDEYDIPLPEASGGDEPSAGGDVLTRPRSLSMGSKCVECKSHLQADLEEFLGQRSDVVLREMQEEL